MTNNKLQMLNCLKQSGKWKATQRGFTLIELTISIALFVIFLGMVASSYISIIRTQREANTTRQMYSEVRSFVESLGQDMRLGTIDYDCYPTGTANSNSVCPIDGNLPITTTSAANETQYLAIISKDQTTATVYYLDNGALKMMKFHRPPGTNGGLDLTSWAQDATGEQTLLSNLIQVNNLSFSVYPPVNPYLQENAGLNQDQFQPKVSLTLSLQNAGSNSTGFQMNFQTTLSSRVYSRSTS